MLWSAHSPSSTRWTGSRSRRPPGGGSRARSRYQVGEHESPSSHGVIGGGKRRRRANQCSRARRRIISVPSGSNRSDSGAVICPQELACPECRRRVGRELGGRARDGALPSPRIEEARRAKEATVADRDATRCPTAPPSIGSDRSCAPSPGRRGPRSVDRLVTTPPRRRGHALLQAAPPGRSHFQPAAGHGCSRNRLSREPILAHGMAPCRGSDHVEGQPHPRPTRAVHVAAPCDHVTHPCPDPTPRGAPPCAHRGRPRCLPLPKVARVPVPGGRTSPPAARARQPGLVRERRSNPTAGARAVIVAYSRRRDRILDPQAGIGRVAAPARPSAARPAQGCDGAWN